MGKYVLSSKQITSKYSFGAQPCCKLCTFCGGVGDCLGHSGRHWSECSCGVLKGGGFSNSIEQWNDLTTQRPLETAWWLLDNKMTIELQPFIKCFTCRAPCRLFYVNYYFSPYNNSQTQMSLFPFHRWDTWSSERLVINLLHITHMVLCFDFHGLALKHHEKKLMCTTKCGF